MQDTDRIKNRIEFLKYIVSTFTAGFFIVYWKIVLENSVDFNKMDPVLKFLNLGVLLWFVVALVIGYYEWHKITKDY